MADKDFGGAMLGGRKRKSIKEKSRTEHMRSVRDLLGGSGGIRKERSDGTAIVAPLRQSRQRQVKNTIARKQ